eukprot:Em0011g216a
MSCEPCITEGSTSGEWITAYRAEQKRHLRAALSSCLYEAKSSNKRRTASRSPSGSKEGSQVLDTRFLLQHCCIKNPKDLCVCHINGMDLTGYITVELSSFDNVVYINASENRLLLEAFKSLPLLQELELALNGITDIHVSQKDFSRLQKLDLSYNSVSTLAMLSLGELPLLRELHLTGHSTMKIRYPTLESLWLDENKLCDQVTFATLAGLRKLKYLNMDNNEIYRIPQLKLLGTSPMKAAVNSHPEQNRSSKAEGGAHGDGPVHQQTTPSCHMDLNVTLLTPPSDHGITIKTVVAQSEGAPSFTDSGLVTLSDDAERNASIAPFPNLETLSLACNLLVLDESLVACAEWPALKELIIYGNPITRVSRGVPPLLQAKLVQEKGIKVVRHKPHPKDRHFVGKVAKRIMTISSTPPRAIPKWPIVLQPSSSPPLALDRAPTPPSLSDHSPSSLSASSLLDKATDTDEGSKGPGVFMTQVHSEDSKDRNPTHSTPQVQPDPSALPSIVEEFEAWKRDAAVKHKDAHPRYKGFEVLLDTHDDASLPRIYDTKSCSQALRYALKHPLMLPGSTPMSRPPTTGHYLLRKSSAQQTGPHTRSKVRELRQVLHDMRERSSLMEASLALVLNGRPHSGNVISELKEGKKLLEEMQLRYKQVRTASLKILEPITDVKLSSTTLNHNQHQEMTLDPDQYHKDGTIGAEPKVLSQ